MELARNNLDDNAVILGLKPYAQKRSRFQSGNFAKALSLPNFQFLELALRAGTEVTPIEIVSIGAKRDKIEAVLGKMRHRSLSKGSKNALENLQHSVRDKNRLFKVFNGDHPEVARLKRQIKDTLLAQEHSVKPLEIHPKQYRFSNLTKT
jgi:predicted nucleic acid-binding OB-fold protein